jgi:hypothetical protein
MIIRLSNSHTWKSWNLVWEFTKSKNEGHRPPNWNLTELKGQLKIQFLPREFSQDQFMRLNRIEQGNRSVTSCAKEFDKLCMLWLVWFKRERKVLAWDDYYKKNSLNTYKGNTSFDYSNSSWTSSKFDPEANLRFSPENVALARIKCF